MLTLVTAKKKTKRLKMMKIKIWTTEAKMNLKERPYQSLKGRRSPSQQRSNVKLSKSSQKPQIRSLITKNSRTCWTAIQTKMIST